MDKVLRLSFRRQGFDDSSSLAPSESAQVEPDLESGGDGGKEKKRKSVDKDKKRKSVAKNRPRTHSADSAEAERRKTLLPSDTFVIERDFETHSEPEDDDGPKKHHSFLRRSFGRMKRRSGSTGNMDPTLLNDIRASLLEYSRIVRQRRGLGSDLYQTPARTYDWDENQRGHQVNWADLFFDLIYVAVAFQLGLLLENTLATEQYVGLWYFYTLFYNLYECWSLKLNYSCRFSSSDISHKFFDIVETLLVAFTAGHISTTVAEMEDMQNGQLLGLVIFKLAHQVLHFMRWLELWIFGNKPSVRRHSRSVCLELLFGSLPLVASVVVAAYYRKALFVVICLFLASMVQNLHEWLREFDLGIRKNYQQYAVPAHYEYCTHRLGESIMLFLGEGVLQITLVQFDQQLSRYFTFLPAYLYLAAIRVLYYSSQPFKAEGHALKQSIRRGFIWLQLQPVECSLITSVGVALKLVMKYSDVIGKPEYIRYSYFLVISSSLLLCLIWISSTMHQGFRKEFLMLEGKVRNLKIATYVWKYFWSLSMLILPAFHFASYSQVSYCLFVCLLQIISHDIWHRINKENAVDEKYLQSLGLEQPDINLSSKTIIAHLHSDDEEDDDKDKDKNKNQGDSTEPPAASSRPAPILALLKQKEKAEEAFKSTFHLGQFSSKRDIRRRAPGKKTLKRYGNFKEEFQERIGENPELFQDLVRIFGTYNYSDIRDGVDLFFEHNDAARERAKSGRSSHAPSKSSRHSERSHKSH